MRHLLKKRTTVAFQNSLNEHEYSQTSSKKDFLHVINHNFILIVHKQLRKCDNEKSIYFMPYKYRAKIEIRFYLKIISYLFAWKKIDNVQCLLEFNSLISMLRIVRKHMGIENSS